MNALTTHRSAIVNGTLRTNYNCICIYK